jgi:hypothetical protein
MNEPIFNAAKRILDELDETEIITEHAQEGWSRYQNSSDSYYLGGVALDLHSFYSSLERIFEFIAINIDKSLPQGTEWHKMLLNQMAKEISQLRPALISDGTRKVLDEYRAFRHLIRNIYTHQIEPSKIQNLVQNLQQIFKQVRLELIAFARLLEKRADS